MRPALGIYSFLSLRIRGANWSAVPVKLLRPLEIRPRPLCIDCVGFVRRLAKLEKRCVGISGRPHGFVRQYEFAHILAIGSGRGSNAILTEPRGLGTGIRIVGRLFHVAAAGPEADGADFVGIGFPGDEIGAGAFGRAASRKAANGEIEAAPEEMDWAAFADEQSAEIVKDIATRSENTPEFVDGFAVVGGMSFILVEGDGI